MDVVLSCQPVPLNQSTLKVLVLDLPPVPRPAASFGRGGFGAQDDAQDQMIHPIPSVNRLVNEGMRGIGLGELLPKSNHIKC